MGENISLFSPLLVLTGDEELFVRLCICYRYQTVPAVLVLYPAVYHFKLFQIDVLNPFLKWHFVLAGVKAELLLLLSS